MSLAIPAESAMPEPAPWLRLLANWGLSLSEAGCVLPAEGRGQCPLRPLLAKFTGEEPSAARGSHGAG
ncbi:hypothetical protein C3942_08480 [Solimonas fluminis]|uniref:Uncharacterized protein n=1 Tax=Solimonas fluminis TaxID=2086571 RepID=A0A2S5TGV2_9GAMM|nr:hypothetical protein [Solimonas fluminis]PPE74068.1 hypothetical protein C3942_08480 [Solimonas fluminis]